MRRLANKTRVQPADGDFPFARIKDTTSTERGTPVNEELYGDIQQYFEKLIDNSEITANELPDSEYVGFQLFQAFLKVGNKYNASQIVKGLIGSYTTNDLIVIHGVVITLSGGNNTATWTAGAIFYNDIVYLVEAGTSTKSSGVFLYRISDLDDNNITIDHGGIGTGIADYNSPSVKKLLNHMAGLTAITNFTLLNSYDGLAPGYYKDVFGNVQFKGTIQTPASGVNIHFATLPVGYRPATAKMFPVSFYGPTQQGAVIYIETSGECRLYDSTTGSVIGTTVQLAIDPVSLNINV